MTAAENSGPHDMPSPGEPSVTAPAVPAGASSPPAVASTPAGPEPAADADADADAAAAGESAESGGPVVVALGASAGGLEAFEQFFRVMPADSGYAFVLVQHLDPSHPSLLTEILQRSTTMPVVEAVDQMEVLPDRVHVIPPNRDMLILQGCLRLHLPLEPHGQRMPIDSFLRSLATDRGERAVGIILSGSGSDGTLGMRAIFGAGGLCLVQDPDTAKFPGMPQSALHAGYATQVLSPDKMPQALSAAAKLVPARRTPAARGAAGPLSSADTLGMDRILALVRSATGHDFSQYKKQTIGRRIERRMVQHLTTSTEVYARYLQQQPAELKALFRELLINVTSFFRDPEAFDVLKREVLPAVIQAKSVDAPLRIWVAGCSTGEEAYSIAMVLRELMELSPHQIKIQFYATDLDDEAIATARAGLYPLNIAQDVSPERLRRFFLLEGDSYRVKKDVREMVVFAVQNLIQDPPFTRLDLLSCRNVMIYLEPQLQMRVVPAFHYALRPGGVLFLSPSESIGSHTELFEPISRKWNFFRARPSFSSTRTMLTSGLRWTVDPESTGHRHAPQQARDGTNTVEFAKRALLQSFAPPAVLTDLQGEVLYVHGDTGKFLRVAQGQPSRSVIDMAREGLELELREALRLAASKSQATLNRRVELHDEGHVLPVDLSVRLLPDVQTGRTLLLLSFEERAGGVSGAVATVPKVRAKPVSQRVSSLELELDYARTRLKSLLEEQLASNEELKSINEEMQSTNEELQSSNEELETSKEELQSVNEELVTVNSELQTKIEQMVGMQDDMKNLLENIRVGTVFLDAKLQIRRFTREATRVYRLLASDLGRPLADIRTELQGGDPIADARTVLDTLSSIERELSLPDGTWFLARTQPYRTVDNVIDGVVLTFTDVTDRVHAIANRQARDLAEAVVDTVPEPLLVLDGALKVMSANRAFFRRFGGSAASVLDQPFFGIEQGQWDFAVLRDLLENVLPRDEHFEARLVEHEFAQLGALRLSVNAHRVLMPAHSGEMTLLVINDMPSKDASP